jgi:2-keto-4-pentenoate hydratase/2-oxohepta-3-ene-1,7-dioic acid hydratase in catechol pathway
MRLVTFRDGKGSAWARCADAAKVLDLAAAEPALPREMMALIAGAEARCWPPARAAGEGAGGRGCHAAARPSRAPKNVFCVGKNYHEHAKEFAISGFDATAKEVVPPPVVFSKPPTSVIGPGEPIPGFLDPNGTDYEGEIAVVIGRGGRGIAKADALRPCLRLHHRQRRHRAHLQQSTPVDPGQGHRRLLPDGPGDPDGR